MSAFAKNLRVVRVFTAVNMMSALEYRGAFLLLMVRLAAPRLLALVVWLAVASASTTLPMSRGAIATYFLVANGVALLAATDAGTFLSEQIRLGRIVEYIIQPASPVACLAGANIGVKIVEFMLLAPLLVAAGLLIGQPLSIEGGVGPCVLFTVCLALVAATAFLFDVVLGTVAFWTQRSDPLIRLSATCAGVLSGSLIPLAFFPGQLHWFLAVQPFRYMLSFPIEVILGSAKGEALDVGIICQVAYPVLFYALYRVLWARGVKRYVPVGG